MRVTLDAGAFAPVREHKTDAGLDIKSPVDFMVKAGESAVIDTGIHIELPPGTVGLLKSKSGLNVRLGILSEGVVDEGYTGSIKAKLYNHGQLPVAFNRGDKITQLVVMPVRYESVEIVEHLEDTERGTNGFGSTGR